MVGGISVPKFRELNKDPIEDLVERWRANHGILLDRLQTSEIPYFGLYGAINYDIGRFGMLREGSFGVDTFYERDLSERRLYQLYHLCSSVLLERIARGWKGGIVVFDLDLDGENVSAFNEKLDVGSGISVDLPFDTEEERTRFNELNSRDNLLDSSVVYVSREEYEHYFRGVIWMKDLLNLRVGKEEIANLHRNILEHRFVAQNVLYNVFDRLNQ